MESSDGAPMTFDPIATASCDRGTAATRAIAPLGSITNIDRSRGSMKSSESPKNAVSAPADGPYEFAPPLTESAMTVVVPSVGSNISELAFDDVVDDDVAVGQLARRDRVAEHRLGARLRRVDQSHRRCCRLLRGEWRGDEEKSGRSFRI